MREAPAQSGALQIMSTTPATPPQYLPLSLAEAKLHCRVDGSEDDALFTGVYIPAATQMCQQMLGRSIMAQAWKRSAEYFEPAIRLLWPAVLSVTSVVYVDVDGATQTLDPSAYVLSSDTLTPTDAWPEVKSGPGAVVVTYQSGFATGNEAAQQAAVPAAIKSWLLLTVGTMCAHRESIQAGVSIASIQGQFVDRLLDPYRVY